ncbi:MAG: hypothetical protein OQK82_01485 [Candidatus Pacearchaeota archaeon]|nr:hypothetical protein [Candidatus Pacearchaeota archaeon]
MDDSAINTLTEYLSKIPAIFGEIANGEEDDGRWWVKFEIDINHQFAWRAVQELGHVLNYLSIEERLPTNFHPVSPPPYMNGGPEEFLSWVIECNDPDFKPGTCAKWLEGRLPNPVDDLSQWEIE